MPRIHHIPQELWRPVVPSSTYDSMRAGRAVQRRGVDRLLKLVETG
jgi:hypothetical protein